jgi:Leucine-rich repeat (LRR) protein
MSRRLASPAITVRVPAAGEGTSGGIRHEAPLPARGYLTEHRDCTGTLTFDDESLQGALRRLILDSGASYSAAALAALRQLTVGEHVEQLGGIECLPWLSELYLGASTVSDLGPLTGLSKLTLLDLTNTPVSDLSPVAGLHQLTRLSLNFTQVSDLTPLAGLRELVSLEANWTKVSDLTPLAGLSRLKYLDARSTQVVDLAPLAGLPSLAWVTLYSAPLDCAAQAATIQALQSRGVAVYTDCP